MLDIGNLVDTTYQLQSEHPDCPNVNGRTMAVLRNMRFTMGNISSVETEIHVYTYGAR